MGEKMIILGGDDAEFQKRLTDAGLAWELKVVEDVAGTPFDVQVIRKAPDAPKGNPDIFYRDGNRRLSNFYPISDFESSLSEQLQAQVDTGITLHLELDGEAGGFFAEDLQAQIKAAAERGDFDCKVCHKAALMFDYRNKRATCENCGAEYDIE